MDTILIGDINYTLEALEKYCWQRLLNASLSYKDVLHNPVVANVNIHGVNMRTVVLRKVWPDEKQLAFNTDIRSGKWADFQQDKNISWLFYDGPGRMQIRLGGIAALHHDDALANNAWEASTMSSRKIYLGKKGPSALSSLPVSGLPAAFESNDPSPGQSMEGRKNFGLVTADIQWMEWLWLNSKGHRRATFSYNSDKSLIANWLVP